MTGTLPFSQTPPPPHPAPAPAAAATGPRDADEAAAAAGPACEARGLSVAYGHAPVLVNADVAVPRGVVMGIVGPNGAGKSTLLKAMLGLVKPLTGDARFFGRPLPEVRRRVAYVPQSASVDWDFPARVRDVVLMGTYGSLGWFRRPGAGERSRAVAAMSATGIADLADRQIGELSGGQRQRVFLARALAQEPDLYFMDEPFQGVDARSQQAIVDVLHELRRDGKTVVIVHHDLATVTDYCDYVTLLNRRIVASGPVGEAFTEAAVRATYGAAVPGVFA